MTTPETTGTAEQNLTLAWERWWAGIGGTPGEIVWEASPGDLEADLDHFAGWFGQVLPVVDVGCGDGGRPGSWPATFRTWSAWMSRPRRSAGPGRGQPAEHRLPGPGRPRPGRAARLHGELGDANVYIRGVLQALPPASRPRAVQAIAALLGATGTLFAKELPPQAAAYFARSSSGTACRPAWPR